MSDIRERYARLFRSGEGTERIAFFSDAVFAIAMTLLVLDLRVPELDAGESLLHGLGELLPQLFAFALSFAIIAVNWMSHHRKFRVIVRFDSGLIQLNLLVLFFVALVPFPTAVLSEFKSVTASVVLYAVSVSAVSVSLLGLWVHAYRAKLTTVDVDAAMFRYVVLNTLPAPLVFVVSIPIAFFSPDAAIWSWVAIIPMTIAFSLISRRIGVSRRSRDSASAAKS